MKPEITPRLADAYSDALSDVICWMDGFKAAGGTYQPDSLGMLRDLNAKLKDISLENEPSK